MFTEVNGSGQCGQWGMHYIRAPVFKGVKQWRNRVTSLHELCVTLTMKQNLVVGQCGAKQVDSVGNSWRNTIETNERCVHFNVAFSNLRLQTEFAKEQGSGGGRDRQRRVERRLVGLTITGSNWKSHLSATWRETWQNNNLQYGRISGRFAGCLPGGGR